MQNTNEFFYFASEKGGARYGTNCSNLKVSCMWLRATTLALVSFVSFLNLYRFNFTEVAILLLFSEAQRWRRHERKKCIKSLKLTSKDKLKHSKVEQTILLHEADFG